MPRTPDPPKPITSETPWRCFEFRIGPDIIAPNSSQEAGSQPTEIPDASSLISPFLASPKGDLYMFSRGPPNHPRLFRIDLDTRNSVATIRSVQAAGASPSPRYAYSAVWISDSLMVVWGGRHISTQSHSDTDIHVFNTSEFFCTDFACVMPCKTY